MPADKLTETTPNSSGRTSRASRSLRDKSVVQGSPQQERPPAVAMTIIHDEDEAPEEEVTEETEEIATEYRVSPNEVPLDAPPSFLLSVDYSGQDNKAVARLYDPDRKMTLFWFDNTGHQPYCYTDLPPQTVEHLVGRNRGLVRTERVELNDLLHDKTVHMTKVVGNNPLAIGGSTGSIRELLIDPRYGKVPRAWEANIRYRNCFTYDRGIVAGMMYRIERGSLISVPPVIDDKVVAELKSVLGEGPHIEDFINTYVPLFFTDVPHIRRIALDIEVYAPVVNRVPDALKAEYPVTAIGLSDNEGLDKCLVLRRRDVPMGERPSDMPSNVVVVPFDDEREMILEAFKTIDQYPVVLTFVGDAFDLNYLYHRAERLGIDVKRQCPIHLGKDIALLRKGVHIDLYRFLKNPSIRSYALSGAYEATNLDSIAKGLLGIGKLPIKDEISKLSVYDLAHYCWQDANITLQITTYKNELLFRLIVLFMRISRLSMEDVTRQGISAWIQSLFRQEHRARKALIPRQVDIETAKPVEAHTEAIIREKRFKGAIVIDPVAGVHFNATVLDFASLYPTIMKRHNISYETVDCPHEECRTATDNRVPETNHWICKKRRGMISQTIGLFRDIRVAWFKAKSKDKSLDSRTREWYSVVERALKVFVNACLPYEEEVVVRDKNGHIRKIPVGSLLDNYAGLEILSVENDLERFDFGRPVFVPLLGVCQSGTSPVLVIRLWNGRTIRCTENHIIPRVIPQYSSEHSHEISRVPLSVEEVPAADLNVNDEILILEHPPLSDSPPECIFLPDYVDTTKLIIGVKRTDYKRLLYKRSHDVVASLIQMVRREFMFSKASKMYMARWTDLSDNARQLIRNSTGKDLPLYAKMTHQSGEWYEARRWSPLHIRLDDTFFALLGRYIAEDYLSPNYMSISQYQIGNTQNYTSSTGLLTRMQMPFAVYSQKEHAVHSQVLRSVIESLCGKDSEKHIPIELLDVHRAGVLLDAIFGGDRDYTGRGARQYIASNRHLAYDIVFLLDALGHHSSIHAGDGMYHIIIETKEHHYPPTGWGTVSFYGTRPARIRSIEREAARPVFDIETGNGWFVATNGIVVHNSYGVTGAAHFELFCMPAAESVTAFGRDAIMRTKKKAESLGVRVLYGDTDSVFLDNPTPQQQDELIRWSQEELGIDLEVDKRYKYVALSERKKNYIGVYDSGQVEVKGLSGKKRNTPLFAQNAFREMLSVLGKVDSPDGFEAAKTEIRRIINHVIDRLENRAEPYSPTELAFRVQITKNLDEYGQTVPQHVRAARMLKDAGYDAPAGTIVEFIKTKGDGVLPVQFTQTTTYWIDKDKYVETLKSVFEQVLDSVGIDFQELLGFTTLEQFF